MNLLNFKTKYEKNAVESKKKPVVATLMVLNKLWIKLLRKVLISKVIYLKTGEPNSPSYFHMVEIGRFGGSAAYTGQVTSDAKIRLWRLLDEDEADELMSRFILKYNCFEVKESEIPGTNVTIDNLPPHVNVFKEKTDGKIAFYA